MLLEGLSALVTGATRGIGKAIALALASEGADVAITYNSNEALAKEVADEIRALNRKSLALKLNVAVQAEAQEAVDKTIAEFGKLSILVNNAGVTKDGLLMRMSEEDWDYVLDTNLKGVFHLTKAAIRPMMSQRSGRI